MFLLGHFVLASSCVRLHTIVFFFSLNKRKRKAMRDGKRKDMLLVPLFNVFGQTLNVTHTLNMKGSRLRFLNESRLNLSALVVLGGKYFQTALCVGITPRLTLSLSVLSVYPIRNK